MGSPPPAGSKNEVLKFRSVNSIVIAPARTGSERSKRTAVNKTDQTNNGISSRSLASDRMFIIVVIKFADPRILETPAKCNEKIAKSTAAPGCPRVARGG